METGELSFYYLAARLKCIYVWNQLMLQLNVLTYSFKGVLLCLYKQFSACCCENCTPLHSCQVIIIHENFFLMPYLIKQQLLLSFNLIKTLHFFFLNILITK